MAIFGARGRAPSRTNYHDNETKYTYTDRNQLETLTAPGAEMIPR